MAELFSIVNKQAWISAPSFVRQRHRYRGPRESEKINAEIGAFRIDAATLLESFDNISNLQLERLAVLTEGGSINARYLTADDNTPTLENFSVAGINPMALRLQRLKLRIQGLE